MDIRFAMLFAHLANLQRDPKKRPEPFTWEDFRIEFGSKGSGGEPGRPVEELVKVAEWWTKALGGVDLRKKPD